MKEKIGYCIYCGQTRMLKVEEDLSEENLNELATEECDCISAALARKRAKTQAEAEDNVEKLFRGDLPEVADLLSASISLIVNRQISKVTIDTGKKIKAQAVRLSNGTVKVERSETNKTVMES